ncbi:MAG: Gfo/Idh/MocA family oxidoreductase, partial [Planctomycetes bacterium]|nr:Gfo/Idh/MocA family oxidoreductase [Planctomycetota bacterium]
REVLDRGDIDIAHIATPPHWHALISIAAADAGCDVYCEKPMTRTIAEGQHVIDAIQRNGRVFRLNTWFRLGSNLYGLGIPAKPLKKLVSSGLLGWPLTVRVSSATGFNWKIRQWSGRTNLKPEPVPEHLDYDFWLGPAPVKPYHPHRTHGSFRGYWDYDGGGLADMGQHYLDPVQYILGKDDTSPVEIEAVAQWPQHPDAVGLWNRVEMTYADGCRLILESGEWGEKTEGQPYLEGPKGKVFRGFVTDPPELKDAVDGLPDPEPMVSDFKVSVLTRQKFGLNEVNGNRSNMLVHLANVAIRTGRKLRFDPVAQRFIGDEEANRLADQPMRAPWHL